MNKKTLLLVGVPVLVASAWLATYAVRVTQRGAPVAEADIRHAIEAANYCSVDADCGLSPSQCHFVGQLVNVREIPKIADLQRRYFAWGGMCLVLEYSGIYDFKRRYCSNGKCVAPRIGASSAERQPESPPPAAARPPAYEK